ncbi:fibrous sheath CABYR-binding protein-like [Salvia splendens]|uniref:fibrous sheath CABYR-binding protein-like n=1 Tax=Salvia splendens TaxID=180675 RepID=UPI001C25F05D|nr:fibrous sheath CABYR-binding protein-like [Salvia splendens]
MVSLEAMAAFLRQQDPNRDWSAGLGQIGGQEKVLRENPSEPIVPSTATLPTPIATSSRIPPEREAPSTTPPHKSSESSETPQHSDSMEIDPISAHYDSDSEEREARKGREQGSLQGAVESEKTLTAGVVPQKVAREEIDLNESAKKQGLMTDEKFQAILDDETKVKETKARPEVPNPVAPPVVKPKPVNRRLVLKADPKADRPKPHRVSQRCLGKWAAKKAKPNTAADLLEIVSEDERETPTKPGEESLPTADPRDSAMVVDDAPQTQGGRSEDTERMVEGLDLASESVEPEGSEEDGTHVENRSTAQEESLAEEEARYQVERKQKGKAVMKKKPSTKKPRIVNTGIVITEAAQRTPSSRREQSDSEYGISEEFESDSDTSTEDEEYKEQQLPNDHRELLHPPAERLRYKRWSVKLTDDVVEEMKLFDSKKLQDAYRTKDDKSKQIKCGKDSRIL